MLHRHPKRPILSRDEVPDVPPEIVDATSVFNPGATIFEDQVLLLARVQTRGRRTHLLVARSDDGIAFTLEPRLVHFAGIENVGRTLGETIYHVYDPRITRIGDDYFIVVAIDLDHGCRLGLAQTRDFVSFRFVGLVGDHESRNGVLLPEQIDGRYLLLERPNDVRLPDGVVSGNTIVLSASRDLRDWQRVGPVMTGRPHYWDELIGPGPPPIRTHAGWLLLYHGIASHGSLGSIYQAGAVLLDHQDPTRVLARTRDNLLEPRQLYELVGQVPNVVFPSGMTVADVGPDGMADDECLVTVYYGGADTVIGRATARVGELIDACSV